MFDPKAQALFLQNRSPYTHNMSCSAFGSQVVMLLTFRVLSLYSPCAVRLPGDLIHVLFQQPNVPAVHRYRLSAGKPRSDQQDHTNKHNAITPHKMTGWKIHLRSSGNTAAVFIGIISHVTLSIKRDKTLVPRPSLQMIVKHGIL